MECGKFKLLAEPEYPLGTPMYRLVANRDIGSDVKAGDMGGLVSGPACLSPEDDCWVHPGALVFGGARVYDSAQVGPGAQLSAGAVLRGNSQLRGSINLVGQFNLAGSESLAAQDVLIVNVLLKRIGQFILQAETIFVLEYALSDGWTNSLTLPAGKCTDSLRASLACRQAGDRVAFMRVRSGLSELLVPGPEGLIPYPTLEEKLQQSQAF